MSEKEIELILLHFHDLFRLFFFLSYTHLKYSKNLQNVKAINQLE